jgi:D-tyrosyl-tRNA(Tyr) deacylase
MKKNIASAAEDALYDLKNPFQVADECAHHPQLPVEHHEIGSAMARWRRNRSAPARAVVAHISAASTSDAQPVDGVGKRAIHRQRAARRTPFSSSAALGPTRMASVRAG